MPPLISVVDGDLLDQRVDAIVNAWNRNFIPWWLLLPQGVSGAIKKRGGYAPFREIRRAGILAVGQAVVTSAGRLPFKGIIHVAALNAWWRSSESIVRACVRNAAAAEATQQYSSIAFPLLGTGTGGLQRDAIKAVMLDELSRASYAGEVIVVSYVEA